MDKKSTNREYDGASFVDKKPTQNPKNWFLGMPGSVICGQKIHINLIFEKSEKLAFGNVMERQIWTTKLRLSP